MIPSSPAIMTQIVESVDDINIAGDDGIIKIETSNEVNIVHCIRMVGRIQESKLYHARDIGAQALKRKVEVYDNALEISDMALFPSGEYGRRSVDPKFNRLHRLNPKELRSSASSSVVSFLRSLIPIQMDDSMYLSIHIYLLKFYSLNRLPVEGSVPQFDKGHLFVPCLLGDYIGEDPIEYTIIKRFPGWGRVCYRGWLVNERLDEDVFLSNSTKHLAYLEKMGFLQSRKIHVKYSGPLSLRMVLDEYSGVVPVICEYNIIQLIPSSLLV